MKFGTQLLISFLSLLSFYGIAQKPVFELKDSLRGSLRLERTYDVKHYDLNLTIDPDHKFIKGSNAITLTSMADMEEIQLDLFENMKILKISKDKKELVYRRIYNAVFIANPLKSGESCTIIVEYEGNPTMAKNAPWDGGFVWSKDMDKMDWIGVACEGDGASLWWPNKDHLADEPESMDMYFTVPNPYVAISNGKLVGKKKMGKKKTTYHWNVSYPINNYNVTVYIGQYETFNETYTTKTGEALALNFSVLKPNVTKAKAHFGQVPKVLEAFEHYLGPYPFFRDGYGLVEAPYLGMEHQSAIAYGNKFQRGYLGSRIPDEFDFDYIILHETAHEYWGNSVSCKDHADMWLHEGFATYMESLFVEYFYGREAALRYLNSQKKGISNDQPLIGPLGVNFTNNPHDIYPKGSWVLQTLRYAINNDSLWFDIFKGFYDKYKMGFATSKDFIEFVNLKTGKDYGPFLRQYLRYKNLPKLIYSVSFRDTYTQIKYKWDNLEQQFTLPVEFSLDGKIIVLEPGNDWKYIEFNRKFNKIAPKDDKILIEVLKTE
ncbi:MAG: M1 family metallopeptidase [Saprospiraceae bacterium]|nr:M1 family metallopeptidase [Candidatus Defluviibacterium haderslevense]